MKKTKRMFSWMNPKLEVRETGDKYGKEIRPKFINGKKIYKNTGEVGKGVFAKKGLEKR